MPTIRCLCLVLGLIFVFACEKKKAQLPRLVSFSDADNKYSLMYNGNTVSGIRVDSGTGAPYVIATYEYANNFIRANLHFSTGYTHVDYYLKGGSLPVSIRKYRKISGVDSMVARVDFYYHNGSGVIDSVALQTFSHLNFIPVYAGQDVSEYSISTDHGPAIPSGGFLYYPMTNVFRSTNPLLYVYSNPVFEFEVFLLPRLFSANTLKKFNGGSFVYDTDIKGNLSVEDYGSVYPFRRTYIYQ